MKPNIARGRRLVSLLSFGDDLFTQTSCPLDFYLELFVNAQLSFSDCRCSSSARTGSLTVGKLDEQLSTSYTLPSLLDGLLTKS
jgi:hypothetical protein